MSSRDAVRKLLEEYKAQLKIVEKSPNNAAAVKKGKDILTQIKVESLKCSRIVLTHAPDCHARFRYRGFPCE